MFRKYIYHDITWYDFKNPRVEEVLEVASPYNFDKTIVRKFLATQANSEAIIHGDVIFLSLFFPCDLDKSESQVKKKQVRFIIGSDFIFTARSDDIRGFYDLKKKIKGTKTNALNTATPLTTAPLIELLQEVYKHIGDDLERLHKSLVFTKKHILSSKDVSKGEVYGMNKKSTDFHRILETQEEVWIAFDGLCKEFFSNTQTTESLDMIMKDYKKALVKSELAKSRHIDQRLLFKRALTRKKRIKRLQLTAFIVVFTTLLVVAKTTLL